VIAVSKNKNQVKNVEDGYMGASDIVNGTPSLYSIGEKEMESALEEINKELGIKDAK
jgi:hypothetical protein